MCGQFGNGHEKYVPFQRTIAFSLLCFHSQWNILLDTCLFRAKIYHSNHYIKTELNCFNLRKRMFFCPCPFSKPFSLLLRLQRQAILMSHLRFTETENGRMIGDALLPARSSGVIQERSSTLFFALCLNRSIIPALVPSLRHVLVVPRPMCLSRKRASVATAASRPSCLLQRGLDYLKLATKPQSSNFPPPHFTFVSMVPKSSSCPTRPHPLLVTVLGYNFRGMQTNKNTHTHS